MILIEYYQTSANTTINAMPLCLMRVLFMNIEW